ncbi:hypothetical protein JYK02_19350 [Corallococcus macrosporus]|uniref:Uncharacterized protein n=1 Tax=Corallococcus macrosporus TaxID=35 RepID=A0ABS3DDF1_9BACT|nr:hypothetical protein [Corallococcus macrosporus]MBN8229671.1 hypothetical protein [Corallococcus macrosporus]
MTSPVSPPPPPAGGGGKGPSSAVRIALIGALVVGVGVGAFVIGRKSGGGGGSGPAFSSGEPKGPPTAGATVEGMPDVPSEPSKMEVPGAAATAAIWVDVHSPAKVRDALARNAWLKSQWDKPLGQGFVSGWAAFLGSTGNDLKASFKGAVLDVVAGQLLDAPFRTVWFSGDARVGTPALLVPKANKTSLAAWDALDAVAKRGGMLADTCPSGMDGTVPKDGFHLSRWLVAEQTLWAARTEDRLVLARHPVVVLQALCTALPELEAEDGVDVEVGFDPNAYGREVQLFTHVLGLGEDTRLQLRVDGDRLVAKGIAGKLRPDGHANDGKPLSDDLLKLVPEDTPVLFAFQLTLPESLEPAQLNAFWKNEGQPRVRTRQVALVWTPRGSTSLEPELALLWGDEKDAEGLAALFSGGARTLTRATLCKHVVLATSAQEVERLQKACEGRAPNMLNAAGPVVAGLRAPSSVVLGVNMGRLLGGLAMDGYAPRATVVPPEIEAARRDLEALPYLGFRGNVQGYVMLSEGFGT